MRKAFLVLFVIMILMLFVACKEEPHVHTMEESVRTPATCSSAGVMLHKCTTCDYSYETEIPMLEHPHEEAWTKDSTGHWHKTTCEHSDEKIGFASHSWDEGVLISHPTDGSPWVYRYTCTECEYYRDEESYSSYYTVDANGILSLNEGVVKADLKEVDIPSIIDGKEVKAIGENCFSNCTNLTAVSIPDGVTSIGKNSFKGCSSLTSITIPDGVTDIIWGAFNGCRSLTSITIPNGVTVISLDVFYGCSGLTSITIPDGVVIIEDCAFYECSGLTSITLPDSVTIIKGGVFEGCSGLTNITIPAGVTSIGYGVFADCDRLTSITIPDSLTSIGFNAFSNCKALTNITIPDGVTSIGNMAFSECRSLTSITIPAGVTNIEENAFLNCSNLTDVYYLGTTSDWSNIQLHQRWKEGSSPFTVVHCSDGDVSV